METALNYTDKTLFFSSNEQKWIFRIRRLAEQNPADVTVMKQPEQNGGYIYAKMPASYLKLSPKMHRELTEEQRQAASERMRILVDKQNAARQNVSERNVSGQDVSS